MGLEERELQPIVDAWRSANPHIVQLWADINAAAIEVVTTRQPTTVGPLRFSVESGILFIALPSGRRLACVKPRLGENRFGGTSILHDGTNTGRWMQLETYGGKLTENIVQAVARDLLTACTRSRSQVTRSSCMSTTRSSLRPPMRPWTRSVGSWPPCPRGLTACRSMPTATSAPST